MKTEKKYRNIVLVFSMLVCSFSLNASELKLMDTLHIREVEIRKTFMPSESGFKKTTLDSLAMKNYQCSSVSELLAEQAVLYIKTYGQGGIASSSFRGTSASHTQVSWNGMNINSPMLGQVDFSVIPVHISDYIDIHYGASAISEYSGALGGSINLQSLPDWNAKRKIKLTQYIGSFGSHGTYGEYTVGNKHIHSKTKLYYNTSKNNFPYLNPKLERLNRKNAGYDQRGILQEFYYRNNNQSMLSLKVWLNNHRRNIPLSLNVQQNEGFESQDENNLRTVLNWSMYKNDYRIEAKSGFIYDYLNYKNELAGINSKNVAYTYMNQVKTEGEIASLFNAGFIASHYHYRVNSINYLDFITRNHLSIAANINRTFLERLHLFLLLKKEKIDKAFSPFIPSAGFEYNLLKNESVVLKANVSKNYHVPSLNDLYWVPGGNPNLKNEEGMLSEFTISLSHKRGDFYSVMTEITGFYSDISNWIIWLPGNYRYFTPFNLKEVCGKGIEVYVKSDLRLYGIPTKIRINYAYTSSKNKNTFNAFDQTKNKQLIHVPDHQLNGAISIMKSNFNFNYMLSYVGKRFISSDNLWVLRPYLTHDLSVGYTLPITNHTMNVQIRIDNFTNTHYQVIPHQPMPGRSFNFILNYQFD